MTTKEKRFPLSLSSVVDQREAGRGDRSGRSASTQTATQNARQGANLAARISAAENGGKKPPEQAVPFASPLVSDGVRRAMVARVAQQGVSDTLVLAALQAIPRHMFLDSGLASQAYVDASLPIGHHQTISQPYIVGRMLEILRNGAALDKVLEIGTGCGYQAAVLSLIAKDVYSVERIKALHELAKNNLRPMRIANIRLHYGDGMLGMPQVAPFDGIILAAAGLEVPHALLTQLKIGGRLIAPVGDRHQVLQLIERISVNDWNSTMVENCHFVPLRSGVI
ncbi:protein-L-isoaspartate(D-aspartate) O-methyltransferase [Undibacterium sp. 14-3-2]|uniref:protein-L-isoaspartate(D-aspartate) O-methyltransferase n=1 Tax=Undibacterium sp. 14-3-2 TaxID=2800129 RepID=UPI0019081DF2|nr:protein-L-isoaspartate(D-aspartate) O-methyltransferase [Undibacterium sp. 14-3-2]MBK1891581.1 protein-L-isoaspartate(D-aspartate) O-methyltransferase [Undibacterium sp. 14-3-2]